MFYRLPDLSKRLLIFALRKRFSFAGGTPSAGSKQEYGRAGFCYLCISCGGTRFQPFGGEREKLHPTPHPAPSPSPPIPLPRYTPTLPHTPSYFPSPPVP